MIEKDNQIGQKVFKTACKVLKKEGHITNCMIAEAIGVDSALMSKWMNGKSIMTRYYNERILEYFRQPYLNRYAAILKTNIVKCLQISRYGRLYQEIVTQDFETTMDFIFNQLTIEDIQKENRLVHKCYDSLKLALVRKTMDNDIDGRFYTVRESVFDHMVPSHMRTCIRHGVSDKNTLIMEHYTSRGVEERVLILLRSRHYYHGPQTIEMVLDFLLSHRPFGQIDRYLILVNPSEVSHYMYSNCPDHNLFYYIVDENLQSGIERYMYFERNAIWDTRIYTSENLAGYSNRIARRILHIIQLHGRPEEDGYSNN